MIERIPLLIFFLIKNSFTANLCRFSKIGLRKSNFVGAEKLFSGILISKMGLKMNFKVIILIFIPFGLTSPFRQHRCWEAIKDPWNSLFYIFRRIRRYLGTTKRSICLFQKFPDRIIFRLTGKVFQEKIFNLNNKSIIK